MIIDFKLKQYTLLSEGGKERIKLPGINLSPERLQYPGNDTDKKTFGGSKSLLQIQLFEVI
jgi:hypothetical protein